MSKELELTLTGKNCGMEERAPMCGIPYHAVEGYLNKLVAKRTQGCHLRAGGRSEAGKGTGQARGHPDRDAGNEPGYAGAGRIQEQLHYVHRVSGRPLRRYPLRTSQPETTMSRRWIRSGSFSMRSHKFSPSEIICNESFLYEWCRYRRFKASTQDYNLCAGDMVFWG